MGKRRNEKFLSLYVELDRLLCEKFGVPSSGVTEYINRLNNARFAPDRDEVLPKLVSYRNIKYRFFSEPATVKKSDEIDKRDILWMRRFIRYVRKKKDPISVYLRRARRYLRMRKLRRFILIFAGTLGVLILILVLLLMLLK